MPSQTERQPTSQRHTKALIAIAHLIEQCRLHQTELPLPVLQAWEVASASVNGMTHG